MFDLFVKKGDKYYKVYYNVEDFVYNYSIFNEDDITKNTTGFSYSFTIDKGINSDAVEIFNNSLDTPFREGVDAILVKNDNNIFGKLKVLSYDLQSYNCIFASLQSTLKERLSALKLSDYNLIGSIRVPLNKEEMPATDKNGLLVYPPNPFSAGVYWSAGPKNSNNYLDEDTINGDKIFKYCEPVVNGRKLVELAMQTGGYNVTFKYADIGKEVNFAVCNRQTSSSVVILTPTTTTSIGLSSYIRLKPKSTPVGGSSPALSYNKTMVLTNPNIQPFKDAGIRIKLTTITENGKEVCKFTNQTDYLPDPIDKVAKPAFGLFLQDRRSNDTRQFALSEAGCWRRLFKDSETGQVDWDEMSASPEDDGTDMFRAIREILMDDKFTKWQLQSDGHYTIELLLTMYGYLYCSNVSGGYDLNYVSSSLIWEALSSDSTEKFGTTTIEFNCDANNMVEATVFRTIDPLLGYSGGTYINLSNALGFETVWDIISTFCRVTNTVLEQTDFDSFEITTKQVLLTNYEFPVEVQNIEYVESKELGVKYTEDKLFKKSYLYYQPCYYGNYENAIDLECYSNYLHQIPYFDGKEIQNINGPFVVYLDTNRNMIDPRFNPSKLDIYEGLIEAEQSDVNITLKCNINDLIQMYKVNFTLYVPQLSITVFVYNVEYKNDHAILKCKKITN